MSPLPLSSDVAVHWTITLSGMWLDVDLRMIPKIYVFKDIGYNVQNMLTILGSIPNVIGGGIFDQFVRTRRMFFLIMKMIFI